MAVNNKEKINKMHQVS